MANQFAEEARREVEAAREKLGHIEQRVEENGRAIQEGSERVRALMELERSVEEDDVNGVWALGNRVGKLVCSKQKQYGDSAGRAGNIFRELYPNGIPTHAYDDALLMVRVIDKLSRIAQRGTDGQDLGGESPWQDIAGYGLLGLAKDER